MSTDTSQIKMWYLRRTLHWQLLAAVSYPIVPPLLGAMRAFFDVPPSLRTQHAWQYPSHPKRLQGSQQESCTLVYSV